MLASLRGGIDISKDTLDAANLRSNRRDRSRLRLVGALMLKHHPNRSNPNLRRVAISHFVLLSQPSSLLKLMVSDKPGAIQTSHKKAFRKKLRKTLMVLVKLVAGVGFEPTTFRL